MTDHEVAERFPASASIPITPAVAMPARRFKTPARRLDEASCPAVTPDKGFGQRRLLVLFKGVVAKASAEMANGGKNKSIIHDLVAS